MRRLLIGLAFVLGVGVVGQALVTWPGTSVKDARNITPLTGALNTTGSDFLVQGWSNTQNGTCDNQAASTPANTWLFGTARESSFYVRARIAYVAGATVDAAQTFTGSGTCLGTLIATHFVGVKTSSAIDQDNGGYSFGTTQGGSITPSEDCTLILSMVSTDDTAAQTVDSGMTIIDHTEYSATNYYGGALAYKIQTTAATINPIWTGTGSDGRAVSNVNFKAASCVSGVSSIQLLEH